MENNNAQAVETTQLGGYLQTIVFNIGSEEFGIDIRRVQGINRLGEVTIDPNAKDQVRGTIISRGKSVPLFDLRDHLGIPVKEYNKKTRFIVVDLDDKLLGIIVDNVNDVLGIPKSTIKVPSKVVSRINSDYIASVAEVENRVLKLLDLKKIPTLLEYQEFSGVAV